MRNGTGQFIKGGISWNKGKKMVYKIGYHPFLGRKHSKDSLEKMSRAHKGLKHSEEYKKRASILAKEKGFGKWMVGKKHSIETIKKMSASQKARVGLRGFIKGQIAWNKGLKTPPEVIIKLANKLKGRKVWNKGKPWDEESLKKMSNAKKGRNLPLSQRINMSIAQGGTGILTLKLQIRDLIQYTQWRKAVFKRDNWTCVFCSGKEGSLILNVDHFPKTFAQIIRENALKSIFDAINCKELWDLANGRTLCLPCHKKTPTYLRRLVPKAIILEEKMV